jgi:hypothetical protein
MANMPTGGRNHHHHEMKTITPPPAPPAKSGRPRGRGTKRTKENAKIILECVSRGMPFVLALRVARLSPQTFSSWRQADAKFRNALEEALAVGVNSRLQVIEKASDTDWRAAAWLLEHCQPAHFARNRLEVTGANGTPLSAGVQLYLPKKDEPNVGAVVETSEADQIPAFTERNGNGEH